MVVLYIWQIHAPAFAPTIKCAPRSARSPPSMAPQSGYRPPRVAAACRRGSSCVMSTHSRTHSSLRTCTTTCTLNSCNWQQAAAPTSSSRTNAILLAASALNAKIAYALLLLLPDCKLLAGAQHAPFFATLIAHHLALQFAQVFGRAQPDGPEAATSAAKAAARHAQSTRAAPPRDLHHRRWRRLAILYNHGNPVRRSERSEAREAARSEAGRAAQRRTDTARSKRRREAARARERGAAEAAGSGAAARGER